MSEYVIFAIPTTYLILNEEHFTFHLQYRHSGTFANRKYEELSYPKNQKMCDLILVTLLKMPPHYSHTSSENATPSSGTSPLEGSTPWGRSSSIFPFFPAFFNSLVFWAADLQIGKFCSCLLNSNCSSTLKLVFFIVFINFGPLKVRFRFPCLRQSAPLHFFVYTLTLKLKATLIGQLRFTNIFAQYFD